MNKAVMNVIASSAVGDDVNEYSYLNLLARVKKALDTAVEVAVPATDIRPFPDQPRKYFNEDSVRRLTESIDAGGQTTSGMIRLKPAKTQYELIDGERRWRAVLQIPETRRPLYKAKQIDADDDVVQYLISGIANFNREGHTAIEVMETIDRLMGFDLPMKEIASLLGISEHWAYQMHGLNKLEPQVRKMLDPNLPKATQLPVVAAVQISKIEAKYQRGLAERVIRKDITLARLRGEVVKVAQKAGSHIRVRDVPPDQLWKSFGNKIDVISRTSGDAKAVIKKGEVNRFAATRPKEVTDLLKKIAEAKESLNEIESKLRRAQK